MRNLFKESFKAIHDIWTKKKKENLVEDVSTLVVQEAPIINRVLYNSVKETCTVITPDGDTFVFQTVIPENLIKYKTLPIEELFAYVKEEQRKFNLAKINANLDIVEDDYDLEDVKKMTDNLIKTIFENHEVFIVKEDQLYFKDIDMPIPFPLVPVLTNFESQHQKDPDNAIISSSYNVFIRFTLKLMGNPVEANRNQLLEFIQRNNVQITYYGNLILYRRAIRIKDELEKLKVFVRESYLKVKKQKHNPKKYSIYTHINTPEEYNLIQTHRIYLKKFQDENYVLVNDVPNGESLYDLYTQYEEEEIWFTSNYDKTVRFKLHDIYAIDEDKIEINPNLCHSGGLHCIVVDGDYSSYGDTPLVVLVNPMKTLVIPNHGGKKMRVTEMYIAAIHENEGSHISEALIHEFDEEFHNYTTEELVNLCRTNITVPSIKENNCQLTSNELPVLTQLLTQATVIHI